MALQTVLDFIARQQRYCHDRQTADDVDDVLDVLNGGGNNSLTPELPHPNVLRMADATPRPQGSLMQLRSLMPSRDDVDDDDDDDGGSSAADADHSDDAVDDEDEVVAHRGFATGWLPVRRRPGHVDFNQSEVIFQFRIPSTSTTSSMTSSSNDLYHAL